jgi:hypothetical protein
MLILLLQIYFINLASLEICNIPIFDPKVRNPKLLKPLFLTLLRPHIISFTICIHHDF